MLFEIRLLGGLAILILAFFFFRWLMRTGKARKAFDMQERDKNTADLRSEAGRVNEDIVRRKQDLLRKQQDIENELQS